MGIVNWLVHRNMKRDAESLAKWAAAAYYQEVASKSCISDRERFGKMLVKRSINFKAGNEKFLDTYGDSLYGFCYCIGLNGSLMSGMMISRCVQYTQYIDEELDKYGFKMPSNEIRRGYFRALGLPENSVS